MNNLELANLAWIIDDEANWTMQLAIETSHAAKVNVLSCGSGILTLYKKDPQKSFDRAFYVATGGFSEKLSEEAKKRALELANNYERQIGSGVEYTEIKPLPPNILVPIDDTLYKFAQEAIPRE